ncbi:hypothetical protein DKM19_19660 [Streptosporangium sp. 'caverna']|nr:hypothetical protein DKM19_19660 [Streptosporangium sp. 'caverna']
MWSMTPPDELEHRFTLLTAATRYDALRTRDALASAEEGGQVSPPVPSAHPARQLPSKSPRYASANRTAAGSAVTGRGDLQPSGGSVKRQPPRARSRALQEAV